MLGVLKNKQFLLPFVALLVFTLYSFAPLMTYADAPTGLEPPTTAYIEAEQGPSGTSYTLKNLFNKDWLANAKMTWKAHIFCGTFTGSTFNPAGCGDLKTINDNDPVMAKTMRICVFLEHKNGEILFGSYPERGRPHGFGDTLRKPSAEELICYGSTEERALPAPAQEGFPPTIQHAEPRYDAYTTEIPSAPEQHTTGWIVGLGVGIAVVGLGIVGFKKMKSDNSVMSEEQEVDTPAARKMRAMKPEKTSEEKEYENEIGGKRCIPESKAMWAAERARKEIEERFDGLNWIAQQIETIKNALEKGVTVKQAQGGQRGLAELVGAYEKAGGDAELLRRQEALDDAEKAESDADDAYDACIKAAHANLRYIQEGDTDAPAKYEKPEDMPDEPEVM